MKFPLHHLLIAPLAVLPGCLVCPHPPGLVDGIPIPPRATDTIQSGVTTRQDVLLLLGQPTRAEMADRYYFYLWNVSTLIVGFGMPPAVGGGDVPTDRWFICFEFLEDGTLTRWERVKHGMFDPRDEQILKKWIADAGP
jgi:outer membrane protein assembly factor BamE (lipoprotein component of BamABCDE complex)